jgi:hypothetical protein
LNIYGAASDIFLTIPLFCPYFETPAGLFGAVDPDQLPERAEISQAYPGFPQCVEIRLKEAVRLNILIMASRPRTPLYLRVRAYLTAVFQSGGLGRSTRSSK